MYTIPPPPKVYNGHTHSSKADSFVCLAYWTPRLCRTSLYAAVILVIHPYSSTLHTCLFFFESLLTILHSSAYKASICQSLFAHVILKWLLTHVRHRSPAPHGRILCVHVSPRVHFPVWHWRVFSLNKKKGGNLVGKKQQNKIFCAIFWCPRSWWPDWDMMVPDCPACSTLYCMISCMCSGNRGRVTVTSFSSLSLIV